MHPIHRRYRTNQQQFWYNRLNTKVYSDTLISKVKSMRGNKYTQVFTNDVDYIKVIPMKTKSEARNALLTLFEDIGMPTHINTDGAKEMTLRT